MLRFCDIELIASTLSDLIDGERLTA